MKDEKNNENPQGEIDLSDLSNFFAPSWTKARGGSARVRLINSEGQAYGHVGDHRDDHDGQEHSKRVARNPDWMPRTDSSEHRRDHDRRPHRERSREEYREERRENPPRANRQEHLVNESRAVNIRFMPDGKALDAIIRRIQVTRRAYPFREIVRLFQKDDASIVVRMEADRTTDPKANLYQCRVCGLPGLSETEIIEHLLTNHMTDFFDVETIEGEPPSGNFPYVARCNLNGELLGPPNHHSYARRIAEVMRDQYPNMTREEFSRHIEMVRDAEIVEKWRQEARIYTLYFRKAEEVVQNEKATENGEGAEESEKPKRVGVEYPLAETIFRREIIPGQVGCAPHIVCPETVLKNMPNRRLAGFLSRTFAHDDALHSRGTLYKALHAAFFHRKLHYFHANDEVGQEFVTSIPPTKLEASNATDEIRAILTFIEEHPSQNKKALLDSIVPDGNEEAVKRIGSSLQWLIERGHIVEFFNGFLATSSEHPSFVPHAKKKRKGGGQEATPVVTESTQAETTAPEQSEAEAPVAETDGGEVASDGVEASTPAAIVETETENTVKEEVGVAVAQEETPAEEEQKASEPVTDEVAEEVAVSTDASNGESV